MKKGKPKLKAKRALVRRDERPAKRDDAGARAPKRDDRGPKRDDRGARDDRPARRDERGPKRDDRSARGDDRTQKRDDRGPKRDDRGPKRDDRGPKRDDRGPRGDDRGPRRDDRGPRGDDRGPRRDDRDGRRPRFDARDEPEAKPARQPETGLRLPKPMLEAWRKTVLAHAKLGRGLNPKDMTPEERIAAVLKQETGAVRDLWEIFTQERGALAKNLLGGKREVVAYLLGFHLANAARAQLAFTRTDERYDLAKAIGALAGPVVWNDLGCGTGAVAHAGASWLLGAGLAPERFDARLSDNTGALLDAARTLFEKAALGVGLKTARFPLEGLEAKRFAAAEGTALTAFSLGYVWNELKKNPVARKRVLDVLAGPAARGEPALVVVLEPATEAIARDAMELRDQLVEAGYVPLYPCPAQAACPMLNDTRDWCYSEGDWARPREVQRLDRSLGLDRSRVTGGLYVLVTPDVAAKLTKKPPLPPVVVGRPERELKQRGEPPFDYLLCEAPVLSKRAPLAPPSQLRGEIIKG